MTKLLSCFLLALAFVLPTAASGSVLGTDLLVTPLAPGAARSNLSLATSSPLDPDKPVWVAYKLLAISASDKPTGSIVLDASFEGVPTSITDSIVSFDADKLKHASSAGTIDEQLRAQIGQRTPQQLTEILGPELYAAYQALNEKKGAILEGTIVRRYSPTGKSDAVLLASVDKDSTSDLQPVAIVMTVGQGEVPPEFEAAGASSTSSSWFGMVVVAGVLLALFGWLWKRNQ
jgi:hypothetical protein